MRPSPPFVGARSLLLADAPDSAGNFASAIQQVKLGARRQLSPIASSNAPAKAAWPPCASASNPASTRALIW